MSSPYLSKEGNYYFSKGFDEYNKNGLISFDILKALCSDFKEFDKAVVEEVFKEIKTTLDRKNSGQQINLKQDEYYNYINQVIKEQDQRKNQADPEMEKLFQSLANKDGEYVKKKKISDIITMFDLAIDLNEFFKPLQGSEDINFNEFCTLFKAENIDDTARKTFYNVIESSKKEPEEKEDIKAIYKANFPIKYYGC